jgi:hypothetical protein
MAKIGGGEWLMRFLMDQGLQGDDLRRMWSIGMRESGGRPEVDNAGLNRDGSVDYGLFQINGAAHGARIKEKFGWGLEDLRDPVKNFQVMRWMSNNGKDLSAWGVANPDGSVTGWAANIGPSQRAKFTAAMNSRMKEFDVVAKKVGVTPGAAALPKGTLGNAASGTPGTADAVDPLTAKQMAARYGMAYEVIMTQPELRKIFQKAALQQSSDAEIAAEIQNSKWYRNNSDYARTAWTQKQMGGADWQTTQQTARQAVEAEALRIGSDLTEEEKNALTHRFLFEGWGTQGRQGLLTQALAENIDTLDDTGMLGGESGNVEEQLMTTAERNGLKLGQNYYTSKARSIASGLTTADDVKREIRAQAASLWPTWKDKIMAGEDARDLADGYLTLYAQEMEVNKNTIKLTDPYIRSAMTQMDEKGDPQQLGLWEFQTKLRSDPRWMKTKAATDSVSSIALDVFKSFGIMG